MAICSFQLTVVRRSSWLQPRRAPLCFRAAISGRDSEFVVCNYIHTLVTSQEIYSDEQAYQRDDR